MNGCEVEIAHSRVHRYSGADREAIELLYAYYNLIQDISDGWAYWRYGVKCSDGLQAQVTRLVSEGVKVRSAAVADARKAIVGFLKSNKQTKDLPLVLEFLSEWGRQTSA